MLAELSEKLFAVSCCLKRGYWAIWRKSTILHRDRGGCVKCLHVSLRQNPCIHKPCIAHTRQELSSAQTYQSRKRATESGRQALLCLNQLPRRYKWAEPSPKWINSRIHIRAAFHWLSFQPKVADLVWSWGSHHKLTLPFGDNTRLWVELKRALRLAGP